MGGILDYNKICENIKKLDPKIRFTGIINPRGRLVAGGMKEGLEPLESRKDDEMLFMELALRVRMRKEFDRQLGKVKFSMSLRDKALAMSFPVGAEDTLYVYAEPSADFGRLPIRIIKLIENNEGAG
jgi:hypothetical protein